MSFAKGRNSSVFSFNDSISIVPNKRGDYPPYEDSLRSFEGIELMHDEDVRTCLKFYGYSNSLCRRTLLKCLGIDTKKFGDDRNHEARLRNSWIRGNQENVTLLVNETGYYPNCGKIENGVLVVRMDTLRNPNNYTLEDLLDFYDLDYDESLDNEERLDVLLSWLGCPTIGNQLIRNREEMEEVEEYQKNMKKSMNEVKTTLNELKESVNQLREENRSLRDDLEKITKEKESSGSEELGKGVKKGVKKELLKKELLKKELLKKGDLKKGDLKKRGNKK